MSIEYQRTRALIAVMTYPHPSQKYLEAICTAGVTEDGQWVRLYPIDYRYLPAKQQFSKYQWIEVGLAPHGAFNDMRKESRKPDLNSIRILGEKLGTGDGWRERRQIISRLPTHTLTELKRLYDSDRVSLGVVRPQRILDLKVEPDDEDWDQKWTELLRQIPLFGEPPKTLRKIPFKFTYVFECEDSEQPHNASLIDWEMGALWLNEVARLQDEQKAADSVKKKFFDEICRSDKDTSFFMGTRHPFNIWMVLGVFWPPKISQMSLFST